MTLLIEVVRVVAQLTAGTFAGACLYIALVQHPARMSRGAASALDDFRATIPLAERLQAPLLIAALGATAADVVLAFSWTMLAGGLLLAAVLAQTIATVLPINRRLLSGAAADHLAEAPTALARWGRLHGIRTVLSVIGALLLLV